MRVRQRVILGVICALVLVVPLVRGVESLLITRRVVATYVALMARVNAQDLDGVRALCSADYRLRRPIVASPGGGVVGFPRNIHKNFQVWREGDEGRLCPSDRVGAVYRFVREPDGWKFAGPVGLLRAGKVEPTEANLEIP